MRPTFGNLLQQELGAGAAWEEETTEDSIAPGWAQGGLGVLWDCGMGCWSAHQHPTHPPGTRGAPPPLPHPPPPDPRLFYSWTHKENTTYCSLLQYIHHIIIYSGANLGPSSLPCYSRTPEGETARSLGRKPEPEGGGVTPCILFHHRDILPKRNSVVLVNDAFRRGDKLHYTMLI